MLRRTAGGADGLLSGARRMPIPVQLALNWKAEPQFGGFYAAQVLGLYAKNSLDVCDRRRRFGNTDDSGARRRQSGVRHRFGRRGRDLARPGRQERGRAVRYVSDQSAGDHGASQSAAFTRWKTCSSQTVRCCGNRAAVRAVPHEKVLAGQGANGAVSRRHRQFPERSKAVATVFRHQRTAHCGACWAEGGDVPRRRSRLQPIHHRSGDDARALAAAARRSATHGGDCAQRLGGVSCGSHCYECRDGQNQQGDGRADAQRKCAGAGGD